MDNDSIVKTTTKSIWVDCWSGHSCSQLILLVAVGNGLCFVLFGMGWSWTAIKTDWWRVATYFSMHCTSEMYWSRSSWLCVHWPDSECRRGLWVRQPVLLLRMDNATKTQCWNGNRISHCCEKYTVFACPICPCVCLNPDECRNETTAEVEQSHTSSLLKPTSPKSTLQLGVSETVETKEIFSCSWEWTSLYIIYHWSRWQSEPAQSSENPFFFHPCYTSDTSAKGDWQKPWGLFTCLRTGVQSLQPLLLPFFETKRKERVREEGGTEWRVHNFSIGVIKIQSCMTGGDESRPVCLLP